jgi:16S rRNA (cytidine1402-2'-O)-methyltransferase
MSPTPPVHAPPSSTPTPPRGSLWLVPAPLDLGTVEVPIAEVLPAGVIERAASIGHWVVENARSARALLKRVSAVTPLAQALQSLQVVELPRPRKGSAEGVPAEAWRQLLAPALAGHDIGLLSEAGLPAVADPGSRLVRPPTTLACRYGHWPGRARCCWRWPPAAWKARASASSATCRKKAQPA